ncbi:hypothetical protein ABIB90_007124 [Bradyrhizobium sp. JR4.1]
MTTEDIPLRVSYTESFVRAERQRQVSRVEVWSDSKSQSPWSIVSA